MALRDYPSRFLFAAVLSSLLLLGLCGTMAVLLAWEQSRTADVLEENIGSLQAAANLENDLAELAVLHEEGSQDLTARHNQSTKHLTAIERFADKAQEQEFVRRIADSYQSYLALWEKLKNQPGPKLQLVRHLEEDTLPACKRLHDFNVAQIDQSEREHRTSLSRMTWGLAVVGCLGSVGGVVLGFGLARGLRRTIQQFMVRVQGAADLLGPELTTVEWQREGESLGDGAHELLTRVEQAVVRLQQREREFRRAERLAALGQLAAGVAHEIRNPLTSVLLLFQTARKDPSAGGLTEEDFELIEQELGRMELSLQTFLDYARPPKLARAGCDLVEVVQDALALTRGRIEQQRVTVDFDAPPGPGSLNGDREQLRQMVLNLMLNALDAMPHGGRLGLQIAKCESQVSAESAIRNPQSAIELTITDTGPGIPAQILPRLFEPFVTGKETGLGLGLVISKRIVEEHGGTIQASNRPEGGASFGIRLPALNESRVKSSQDEPIVVEAEAS